MFYVLTHTTSNHTFTKRFNDAHHAVAVFRWWVETTIREAEACLDEDEQADDATVCQLVAEACDAGFYDAGYGTKLSYTVER